MGEPWPIYTQLQQLFNVRTLTSDLDHIDKDVDVLMLVHPKQLAPKTLYAIDQFVMRGGRVLLLVDPDAGADLSGQNPSNPMAAAMANHSSDLQPLLATWGVDYDPTKVVGDLGRGLEVRTNAPPAPVRHIGILGLRHANMGPKDVVTASLESINMATVGLPDAARRRQDHVRAVVDEFHERRTSAGATIQGAWSIRRPCAMDSSPPASVTPLPRASPAR